MVNTVNMKLGEKRNIKIMVNSTCCKPFEIMESHWALKCGEETESTGDCTMVSLGEASKILGALIEPMRKNCMYTLEYTYEVYPERFIYDVHIRVS